MPRSQSALEGSTDFNANRKELRTAVRNGKPPSRNSIGRERLYQLDKTVYLASIIDIKKNRWSYVFDMEHSEPIRNIPILVREEFDYE